MGRLNNGAVTFCLFSPLYVYVLFVGMLNSYSESCMVGGIYAVDETGRFELMIRS